MQEWFLQYKLKSKTKENKKPVKQNFKYLFICIFHFITFALEKRKIFNWKIIWFWNNCLASLLSCWISLDVFDCQSGTSFICQFQNRIPTSLRRPCTFPLMSSAAFGIHKSAILVEIYLKSEQILSLTVTGI